MLSEIGAFVQTHDRRRFLTALFAPAARREALFTLYAFNHELARAREVASDPMLALIRLQWWREVVEGAVRRHEVASPLGVLIAEGVVPRDGLLRMIEGRELAAEGELDAAAWPDYLRATGGAVMAMAGTVLGAGELAPALIELGAGCAAAGELANARSAALSAGGMDPKEVWAWADRTIGSPRRWPRDALPAALPAVFARRDLAGRSGLGAGSVAALFAAAASRRC